MDIIKILDKHLSKLNPRVTSLLLKSIKAIPFVKKRIQKEYDGIMSDLEDVVKPYKDSFETFSHLPETGRDKMEIIKEMERLNAIEESKWKDGFVSGAVYHGDEDHIRFLNQVYALNSQSNPLHSDIWPSTIKYESEVVSMAADMLGAGELLSRLNRAICHHTLEHQFVTLVYGIWDADSCTFTYSRAGHPPVLHYQAATGCVSELKAGGMVLGVCEEMEYPAESVSLEVGDALVIYTDGIVEAINASDEVFGIHRLSEVVAAHGKEPAEALTTAILTAASQFAHGGWEDDVTLIAAKRIDV